jgi:pilus assembly protein CpaC
MADAPLIQVTRLAGLIFALVLLTIGRSPAAELGQSPIHVTAGNAGSRFVPLGIGTSTVINLPSDVKEVLIADPSVAEIVLRSSRRAYMIGKKIGQTNVFFFGPDGQQIGVLDIAVKRDLNGIREALRKALPHANIHVEGIGEQGVLLTGTVANAAESQLAYNLARQLVDSRNQITGTSIMTPNGAGSATSSSMTGSRDNTDAVVNGLTILGRDQVMLKVTVAEIQRDVIKQLGINLAGQLGSGSSMVTFNTDNPFTAQGSPLSDTFIRPSFGNSGNRITATIRAMERAGVIRTLAEPSLTAISGESSSFLAGGEFPVPAGRTCDPATGVCQDTILWKKFGVGLSFTPVVLGEGRISLRVLTEVSELSSEAAVQIAGLTIPSLRTRRAETTVEMPSGGSLAMAGMIQEQTKQQINGLPGLMQLPVLGALFKSRDFINRQTELVVLVTPYVVRAVAQKHLARPDDGFADASDPATILLGRLNRLYGARAPVDAKTTYRGNYGFILD